MTLLSFKEGFRKALYDISVDQVEEITCHILNTIKKGGCVYICGNGGSGSNANLFAAAILNQVNTGIHIVSLNANMSVITAEAECSGYDNVFSSQMENAACYKDILIAISGSGNSLNILKAVATAKKIGMYTIGLTGMGGGRLVMEVDMPVIVNSDSMEQVENVHTIIILAVSMCIAQKLGQSDMRKNTKCS